MNLRHLTSLAAIFVAGLCMADEPPADPAPPSRPYVHNALVAASQRRKPQQSGQAQLQSRGRQDMMAYSGPPPSRFAQREVNPPPPDTTEKQADPFADPAPQKEPAAAPAAEMPTELPADAPPEAEPPTRPSDDLFTEPPAGPERPTRRATSEPTGPFAQPPAGAAPTITAAQSPATAGGIRSSAP